MEQEQRVESEPDLDTFSLLLPLPYRIAVILVAGTCDYFYTPISSDVYQTISGYMLTVPFRILGLGLESPLLIPCENRMCYNRRRNGIPLSIRSNIFSRTSHH